MSPDVSKPGQTSKFIVSEAYLCFVTSVIAPLKVAVENPRTECNQVLRTLESMKDLIACLEEKCKSFHEIGGEGFNAKSTIPREPEFRTNRSLAYRNSDASMVTDLVPKDESPGDAVASPLDKWISSARTFASRQRSIAREIEILRTLEEAQGGVFLKQLQHRLITLGLSEEEGQAAVVTQISRWNRKTEEYAPKLRNTFRT
jgi:hypothetical protein